MKQRLIFLDVDGTLCPRGSNTPPPSALEAIRAAQDNGHRVFLSSGRSLSALAGLLSFGFDGVISSAGGYVKLGEQVLFDHPMDPALRDRLLSVTALAHVLRVLECSEGCFGDEGSSDPALPLWLRDWWQGACTMLGVRPLSEYRGEKAYKLVFAAERMEQFEPLRQAAEGEFRLVFQPAGRALLGELIHRSFHKGQGVRQICAALGAELSQTVCFGDSLNDREMMEVAGTSVAMADGDEQLKQLCQHTCPPAAEDGLKKAFEELGLI